MFIVRTFHSLIFIFITGRMLSPSSHTPCVVDLLLIFIIFTIILIAVIVHWFAATVIIVRGVLVSIACVIYSTP
jgi:hypothetical protein